MWMVSFYLIRISWGNRRNVRGYRTSGCAKQAIVLYEYQPTRKAEHTEAFLKGFSGWLHADGYQGDTTDCRGTSVWWAAGHMRGENLTRH